jgi:hypothetical protein
MVSTGSSGLKVQAEATVCRQNISDLGLAILETFDGFPPFEHGRSSAEVDVSRC